MNSWVSIPGSTAKEPNALPLHVPVSSSVNVSNNNYPIRVVVTIKLVNVCKGLSAWQIISTYKVLFFYY